MTSSTATAGPAKIRPLTAIDLPIVSRLLSERDNRIWDTDSARWFLQDLEPDKCRAWAAFDGEKPVGLTTMFLRTLQVRGNAQQAAYWANLYVDPAYRDQMLYPRLPMAMLNSLKSLGIPFIYAPVRIPQLAKAHLGLGFAKIGRMEVLVRPLRPARFLAKYKKFGTAARTLAGPVDVAFQSLLWLRAARVPSEVRLEAIDVMTAPLGAIAKLLTDRAADRIAQPWNASSLRERYRQTREGGNYSVVTASHGEELTAVAIQRVAERGDGIHVCVVMELAFRPGAEADAAAVLRRVELDATAADCELLIYLDGLGSGNRELLLRRGFRSSPEVYELLIWPKKAVVEDERLGDGNRWEFGFRDHDAF
jgi:predicted N-acetyltransferase YhbS